MTQAELPWYVSETIGQYKKRGNKILGWLQEKADSNGNRTKDMVEMADLIAYRGTSVEESMYYVLSDAIKERTKVSDFYVQRGDDSNSNRSHQNFITVLKYIRDKLYPNREPGPSRSRVEEGQATSSGASQTLGTDPNYFTLLRDLQDERTPSPVERGAERLEQPLAVTQKMELDVTDKADVENDAPDAHSQEASPDRSHRAPRPLATVQNPPGAFYVSPEPERRDFLADDPLEAEESLILYLMECDNIFRKVRGFWTSAGNKKRSIIYSALLTDIAFQLVRYFTFVTIRDAGVRTYDEFFRRSVFALRSHIDDEDSRATSHAGAGNHSFSVQQYPFFFGYGHLVSHAACGASLQLNDNSFQNLTSEDRPVDDEVPAKITLLLNNTIYPSYRIDRTDALASAKDWVNWIEGTKTPSNILFRDEHCSSTHFSSICDLTIGLKYLSKARSPEIHHTCYFTTTSYNRFHTAPLLQYYDNPRNLSEQLELETGLTLLLETQKAFVERRPNNPSACSDMAMQFAIEVQLELNQVHLLCKKGGRMPHDNVRLKDFEKVIKHALDFSSDAYSQAPWVAGKRILDLNRNATAVGCFMCERYNLLSVVLHNYNMMSKNHLGDLKIDILEALCDLLVRPVFSGERPTEQYDIAIKKFLGHPGRLSRKGKQGLNTFDDPEDTDRILEPGFWSAAYAIHTVGYLPVVQFFEWANGENLEVYGQRNEPNAVKLKPEMSCIPAAKASVRSKGKWSDSLLNRVDDTLAKEFKGDWKTAKINWLRVYRICRHFALELQKCYQLSRFIQRQGDKIEDGLDLLYQSVIYSNPEDSHTLATEGDIGVEEMCRLNHEIAAVYERIFAGENGNRDFYMWKYC